MNTTTRNPPTLSYRSGREDGEKQAVPVQVAETANRVFSGITWVILGIVLTVWAVVGAVFWIPLVLRAMLRFSVSHIEAMFENQKPLEAGRILRHAVDFYRRGFVVAVEVVTREEIEGGRQGPVLENRLLLEVLWAVLVWYFIFFGFGWVQASPIDIWNSFLMVPWGETFEILSDPFRR